jgi:hypothetical protein
LHIYPETIRELQRLAGLVGHNKGQFEERIRIINKTGKMIKLIGQEETIEVEP